MKVAQDDDMLRSRSRNQIFGSIPTQTRTLIVGKYTQNPKTSTPSVFAGIYPKRIGIVDIPNA